MTLKYTIEQEDLMVHALYMTSKTKKLRKRRNFSWFALPVICLAGGLLLQLTTGDITYMNLFLALGLGWLIIHPFLYNRITRKQLEIHLGQKFNHPEGVPTTLSLFGKKIEISDPHSEKKIKFADITDIIEIPGYVFLRLNTGRAIIIPAGRLTREELDPFLDKMEKVGNLKRFQDLKWKWR